MKTEDDTQATCIAIRLALSGDDGRCRRKCDACEGKGTRSYTDCSGPTEGAVTTGPCWKCKALGWIENRERIAAAVMEWYRKNEFSGEKLLAMMRGSRSRDYETSLRIWDNREGATWQEELEAHVLGQECGLCFLEHEVGMNPNPPRDGCDKCNGTGRIGGYCEPAPRYDTEAGMKPLKALLRESGPWYSVGWDSHHKKYEACLDCGDGTSTDDSYADTEHEALFEAVRKLVAATLSQKGTER